jgi:predicted RND superfamily exporter protein
MGLVSLVSLGLVVALLALGLRSLRLIVAMVATLFVGLLMTAGFATLAIGQLNIISVAFAVLFIGLSVDFGIHYALRYREGLSSVHGVTSTLARAAVGVGGALCLSAVTAAIGFFSFLPTAYRGLAELGLISGVGMFIALLCNLTVLPAMLSLLPLAKQRAPKQRAAGASVDGGNSRGVRKIAMSSITASLSSCASGTVLNRLSTRLTSGSAASSGRSPARASVSSASTVAA